MANKIIHIDRGIETRSRLYQASKKEFYEYGFRESKIQRITDSINVPIGLFSYYFKTKDTVVSEIYAEYLDNIYEYLNQYSWFAKEKSLFQHLLASKIYYGNIFADPKLMRFYCEVLLKQSNYRVFHYKAEEIYRNYIRDYELNVSDENFAIFTIFDFGCRRELFIDYYYNNRKIDMDNAVVELTLHAPKLMMIPKEEIYRTTALCDEYYEKYDYSSFKLL